MKGDNQGIHDAVSSVESRWIGSVENAGGRPEFFWVAAPMGFALVWGSGGRGAVMPGLLDLTGGGRGAGAHGVLATLESFSTPSFQLV